MPIWGNTDTANNKPKFPLERQVREVVRLTVTSAANTTDAVSNVLTFAAGSSDVANAGILAGWSVFSANTSTNPTGIPGFFTSNTTVLSVTGTTVKLSQNLVSNIAIGTSVEFDNPIVLYNQPHDAANTYWSDTILVTATRAGNANTVLTAKIGNVTQGWNNITQKINNDGTVRYLKECLVALANTSASNTNSGNTSTGQIFTGL